MAEIPLLDDPHAPDLFATGTAGFLNLDGTIVITLEALRSDHSSTPAGKVSRLVVGRLVLPAKGAQRLALGLNDFLSKQGLDPSASLKGDAHIQ